MLRRPLHIGLLLLSSLLLFTGRGTERAACTVAIETVVAPSFDGVCVDTPAEERDDLFPDAPLLQPVIVGDRRANMQLAIERFQMPLSVEAPTRRVIPNLRAVSDRMPFSYPLSVLCVNLS